MQASLSQYISDLEKTTATKAAIESELSIARRIQMSMIPNTFPPFPSRTDIDIFSSLTPAKTIGGDVFDYFIRDEKLYFCIGDVSGKGIPAALMMTVTHALFETIAAHEEQPQRIISMINDAFMKETDADMFCTFFMGVLNLQTGTLTYCNAGHEYPLLIGKGVEKLSMLPNLPLGTIEGFTYKEQEIQLQPGAMLFLYTDGLTDANNIEEERFDRHRVIATAEQALGEGDATPNALIQMMTRAVNAFVGEADQIDDLAMLAIKYR
jgi:sigma-B regulation protein RsbU (phosphoserine phosphatase)